MICAAQSIFPDSNSPSNIITGRVSLVALVSLVFIFVNVDVDVVVVFVFVVVRGDDALDECVL